MRLTPRLNHLNYRVFHDPIWIVPEFDTQASSTSDHNKEKKMFKLIKTLGLTIIVMVVVLFVFTACGAADRQDPVDSAAAAVIVDKAKARGPLHPLRRPESARIASPKPGR